MISICLVDDAIAKNLRPLTDLRSVATIPLGSASIGQRWAAQFPNQPISVDTRPDWLPEFQHQLPAVPLAQTAPQTIIALTRFIPDSFFSLILDAANQSKPTCFVAPNGTCVAVAGATLDPREWAPQLGQSMTISNGIVLIECPVIERAWDIIGISPQLIDIELNRVNSTPSQDVSGCVSTRAPQSIWISPSATIDDFVMLDASSGPIVIDHHAVIESHTRISGPTYIGSQTHILGGKVRGCCIGPNCKISGEMSASVVAGYSNKAHDGFFGHSYIGQWVNVGAGSITSNLKNTYGTVSLDYYGKRIDTGLQFLGALIGDHAKLGIGSHLATGSIVGTGASVFGTRVHAKRIPDFAWGESGSYSRYQLDVFERTASRVRARRGLTFRDDESTLVKQLYESH